MKTIQESGFTCDFDAPEESLGKRVRNAQIQQVNYMLTVGDKEVENKNFSRF